MEKENLLFTNRQLKNMILPLLMEQFLLMLVGLADTFVVSYVGEAAVSGVSLVNSFNAIFLFLFTALAIYNTGSALYRSIGKTSVTMKISIVSNAINVAGNLIGVFVLHAGVAGVAYPSLITRTFSAVVITVLCFHQREIRYYWKDIFAWDDELLKKIMGIAVPNGIESDIFQFVKVALTSVIAMCLDWTIRAILFIIRYKTGKWKTFQVI